MDKDELKHSLEAKTNQLTDPNVSPNPWRSLREYTPARIALGRAGSSLPTQAGLEFQLAHAAARDAVHSVLNVERLENDLQSLNMMSLHIHSEAPDRATYLLRPDLGRRLDTPSKESLAGLEVNPFDVTFILADGLSARAVQDNAAPLLAALWPQLENWRIAPLLIARQARVALTDSVGDYLNSTLSVMLIGERPGLSAADSLGVYLTYAAKTGRTDAERNCISNIRPGGLSSTDAAAQLYTLMRRARHHKLSGVALGQTKILESEA